MRRVCDSQCVSIVGRWKGRKEHLSMGSFLFPIFFQLSEMSLKQHSGCRDRLRGERKREPRTSET